MNKEVMKNVAIMILLILVVLLFSYILFQKHGLNMYNKGFNDGIIKTADEQTKTGYIYAIENNSLTTIPLSTICYGNSEDGTEINVS